MVAAVAVDNHIIAPVTLCEDQAMLGKRGGERLPAVGAVPAIMDRVADRLEVGSEASRLFKLGARGGFGFDVRTALVRDFRKPEFLFEGAAKLLHLVFVKSGVNRGERGQVDP